MTAEPFCENLGGSQQYVATTTRKRLERCENWMFVSLRSVATGHPTAGTNVPMPVSVARIPEHDVRATWTAHHS